MSGGAYDYTLAEIEELVDNPRTNTRIRKAFKALLYDVMEAIDALEQVDSGDWGEGDEEEAIRKCFRTLPREKES